MVGNLHVFRYHEGRQVATHQSRGQHLDRAGASAAGGRNQIEPSRTRPVMMRSWPLALAPSMRSATGRAMRCRCTYVGTGACTSIGGPPARPSTTPQNRAGPRIVPRRIVPRRIGPRRVGPRRIGPRRVGPRRVGPRRADAGLPARAHRKAGRAAASATKCHDRRARRRFGRPSDRSSDVSCNRRTDVRGRPLTAIPHHQGTRQLGTTLCRRSN
jgi:hypothetical protein